MIVSAFNSIFSIFLKSFISYLPIFFGGLLVFLAGLIIAGILKKLLISLLEFFKFSVVLTKIKLAKESDVKIWEQILAELLKWTIIILFLIPTAEIWGLSKVTTVFNELLLYLPNVLVSVVIGFVGIVFAHLISDLVKHSVKSIRSTSANTLAVLAKAAIIFFTVLIVMNQLGIAQDLIRILFTGIVIMLSLAGGLAFGLGGKDMAKEILDEFRKKVQ